ncbi:MAG: hypothetical protein KF832_02540 [Caldilineaceae bacterium]|nr:hypothetical protein [Caldilineaceae bacterium]
MKHAIPLLFGPYGSGSLPYIGDFAAYNVNALWFHGFDTAAFAACAQHGIAPCVEFKTFRANFAERPELVPIGVDGRPIRYGRHVQGVCLSQQAFLEETEANLVAGLRAFQPVGIWLDYLTYGGWFEVPEPDLQESCFCPACIATFCAATGLDATTPRQILTHHQAAWTQHKCERIAHYALHYANLIRQQLPTCIIGAYMCPWTPTEFDGALSRIFAQDYQRLAPAIDVFTPLIYGTKSGRPASWGPEWLTAAVDFVPADRPVQLIADALDFPASLAAIGTAQPPSWGLQIFGGAQVFANPAWARLFQEVIAEIRSRV